MSIAAQDSTDYKTDGPEGSNVEKDSDTIASGVNPATEDSDAQLQKDDSDAIDQSNIVEGRTRGAKPSEGYAEPGDEEGLPSDDGTSSTA